MSREPERRISQEVWIELVREKPNRFPTRTITHEGGSPSPREYRLAKRFRHPPTYQRMRAARPEGHVSLGLRTSQSMHTYDTFRCK
jgi:hypothetical protein